MSFDTKFLEAMISRICHDLISPISAVNNGTELVADLGTVDARDGAFGLIQESAQAASIKLQAFRLAYGAGGSEWHVSLDDVEKIFADLVSLEKRHTLAWEVDRANTPAQLKRGLPKIVMLTLMWALETLPKGGSITIKHSPLAHDKSCFTIEAKGEAAALKEGSDKAFAGNAGEEVTTPKLVHAAATGYYASHYGIDLSFEQTDDCVTFKASA